MKVKAALEVQWVQVSNPGSEYLCGSLWVSRRLRALV